MLLLLFTQVTEVGTTFSNWVESAGDGAIADEVSLVHAGSHAAKLTAGASADTYIYQTVTVTPSSYARLQFYTRGDGTNGGRYLIYDITHSSNIINLTPSGVTGTIYVLLSLLFWIPSGCTSVQVQLHCPAANGGVAYYDDTSLKYRTKK